MLRLVVVAVALLAAPPTKDERRAAQTRGYFDDAVAAGSDAVRIQAVLKKWYAPSAIKAYIENQRNCLSELRGGGAPSLTCRGNGLSCTEGAATIAAISAAGDEVVATLASGDAQTTVTLTLAPGKKPKITSLRCADPAAPETASAPPTAVRGHCDGTASCGDACDGTGCHRIGAQCAGVPLSCSLRTAQACDGDGCHWVP